MAKNCSGKQAGKGLVIEEYIYAIVSSILLGGRSGSGKSKKYDAKEVSAGKKVEMEHLSMNTKNPAIKRIQEILAEKIAKDHLTEVADYYTRLLKMEKNAEMKKSEINNLNDLSMSNEFSTLLGYTKKELENYFGKEIEELACIHHFTVDTCYDQIKEWYNGYQFSDIRVRYP